MRVALLAVFVMVANVSVALDLEEAALAILTGKPLGPDNCFVDSNGDGVRDGTTAGISMDAVRAITNRADVIAAAQAKEQAPQDVTIGKAKLRTYADGSVELVSGLIIIPGTTNGAYEVWVDSDTGLVLSVLDHASPRKTQVQKDADKAKKRQQIAAVKAATTDKDKLAALLVLLGLANP